MHGLGLMHTNKLWHTSGARLQTSFTRPFRSKFTPFVPISVQAAPKPAPERSSRPKRHGPHRLRPHEKVTAAPEVQRLNKAIAAAGLASRRGADELILAGKVQVNGEVVQQLGVTVNMSKDKVVVDGKPLSAGLLPRKYYFALNKPKGYICSTKLERGDEGGRLVVDLFQDWLKEWKQRQPKGAIPPRLFPVGRLDVQSVGLIFVTNDGDWAHKVMHPSTGITKEYSVTLNRKPTMRELETMGEGCMVDGAHVEPVAVALDDTDTSKPNRIRVVVAEGRNREVRTLVDHAGLEVRTLRRVRVGGYRLPREMAFGQYRELRPHEVRRVINAGADRMA